MTETEKIIDYLENWLRDAELYYEVYDYHEAMHECEQLPEVIRAIKDGEHLKPYEARWTVEEEDLAEYREDTAAYEAANNAE